MHRLHTITWLMVAYLAAVVAPQLGLWLRGSVEVEWGVPQLLLACLLFSSAVAADQNSLHKPPRLRLLARVCLFCIVAPLVTGLVAIAVLWHEIGCPNSVALGLLVVIAMPVANSSIGWSTHLRASTPLAIATLLATTLLSPLVSSSVIGFGAQILNASDPPLAAVPWRESMSFFFALWVLLPILLGLLLSRRLGPQVHLRAATAARGSGFAALVLLNYINGAACLPQLVDDPQILLWPMLGVLTVLGFSHLQCWWFANSICPGIEYHPERVSLTLSVLMRNTGAALVFAGTVLPEHELAGLTIITYTLAQHLWVAFSFGSTHQPSAVTSAAPALRC